MSEEKSTNKKWDNYKKSKRGIPSYQRKHVLYKLCLYVLIAKIKVQNAIYVNILGFGSFISILKSPKYWTPR